MTAATLRSLLAYHGVTMAEAERRLNLRPGLLQERIGPRADRPAGPREVIRVHRALGLPFCAADLFPDGEVGMVRWFCGDDPPLDEPYDLDRLGPDLRAAGIGVVDVAEFRDRAEAREAARFGWGQVLMVVRSLLGGG